MAQKSGAQTERKILFFGRYRAVKILGEGSMGRVYLAEDPVLQRKLAVKVIAVEKQFDDENRQNYFHRFLVEARASAKLNHPSIVMVYDAGQEHDLPWIAFEYIDGESLADILKREKKLPIMRVQSIALQIASALQHAHTFEIIHRDIKPANILLDAVSGIAKLADFGIVKAPWTELTQDGQAVGSPGYMSPEQINGEPLDAQSDLFSFGVVMYQMVTGEHPFYRDTAMNTLFATLHGKYRSLPSEVPHDMVEAITGCLATDKSKRFSSAVELIGLLKTVNINKRVTARYARQSPSNSRIRSLAAFLYTALYTAFRTGLDKGNRGLHSLIYWAKHNTQSFIQKRRANAKTEVNLSTKIYKEILAGRASWYKKNAMRIKEMVTIVSRYLYRVITRAVARFHYQLRSDPIRVLRAGIYGLIGCIVIACIAYLISVSRLKSMVKDGTVEEAQQAVVKLDKRGFSDEEDKRIAECKRLIREQRYEEAGLIAKELIRSESAAVYGHILSGHIAIKEEDYKKATTMFQQAQQEKGGERVLQRNLNTILSGIEPILRKRKAPKDLITLIAETLCAAGEPLVQTWIRHTHYWIRWNAVAIQQQAGQPVDFVAVYILDLKYAGSMRTRARAARKLGKLGDRRAIKPLQEAKDKGFRDPYVAGVAATVLEEHF